MPLKYLSNFWRKLEIPLINFEVSLILVRKLCITKQEYKRAVPAQENYPTVAGINHSKGATFKITDTKWYFPVVTLSTQNDNKLLEQLRKGFKGILNGIDIDQKCLIRLKITI